MRIPLFVCPPKVESLFPPVLSRSCNQIPVGFKVWFSRNSSSRCQSPKLGSMTWGSESSLQWVNFCGINVLQSVSHPPSSYGIWFYCDCAPPAISVWLLLCPWTLGIFFGEFQCPPVDDCPAASCDLGALAGESEHVLLLCHLGSNPSIFSSVFLFSLHFFRLYKPHTFHLIMFDPSRYPFLPCFHLSI